MAIYDIKEAKPAPINNRGIIFWLRKNLFSDIKNSLLSVFCIYFLYLTVPPALDWLFFSATWSGSQEDIVNDGARWIFIIEKFDQFIYGFYPEALHWRPLFVAALTVAFIASVKLLKNIKLKIIIILLYPFVSIVFIHGGLFGLETVETNKWGGLMLTVIVAAVGIIASFPIGILLALGRQSDMPIVKTLCVGFIEFVRGVPLITILFMASVVLPLFFHDGIDFDKLLRALIGITLFQAAYIAEVVRGGLQAIPKGQYEASESLGLSYWQGMILIILPQALKISIPNLVGSFISLFKDTTLVLIIGLFDILAMVTLTNSDSNWLGYEVEGYVFVTFIYWVFCFSMSQYSKSVERRFNTELK
ncbi:MULTISPECIES: amino acid ABC transporter permease [unclassified Motilimonas]|uniref:amino acid ABC transporter permease n=1 Tax=Motilimonas TaxID=1914248 RepID=UPI001E3E37BA|nr:MULTISPECIES: amino acid ABC transporter permease [unclassified Motilimonas]MCE0555413.1 amino acid ABC transporter permease [Motilimonas sp. E26]MDO6527640.1 amino acid ABC transporter permease [Motilimonas sp. 1_MG-2023]